MHHKSTRVLKRTSYIWRWLVPVVAALLTACGHDELVPDEFDQEPQRVPYFELRIAMPAEDVSRANPMGGEEGNGREQGLMNEDKIHDINVFFYQEEEGKGMNSPEDTPILKQIYYNIDNKEDVQNSHLWQAEPSDGDDDKEAFYPYMEKNYLVVRLKCTASDLNMAEKVGINFLVIANAGYMQDLTTLGALVKFEFKHDKSNNWSNTYDACSKDASKMDYFLMSTAYNENYTYSGRQTGSNKITKDGETYTGVTTLQRMYSRLDLWYDEAANSVKSGDKTSELKYAVDNTSGNTVYVTNVMPVNVMKTPSYVFKKVTDDPTIVWGEGRSDVWNKSNLENVSAFKWGGKETPSEYMVGADLPTNYVMTPMTLKKEPGGNTASDVLATADWYGNTAVSKIRQDIAKDLYNKEAGTDNGKLTAYYHGIQNRGYGDPDYNCDRIAIVSYANENTHPTDCFHSNYLTGMAFRAVYVPGKIYKGYSGADAGLVEMTDAERNSFLEEGKKIYRYSPSAEKVDEAKSLYFTSMEALDAYRKDHGVDGALVTPFDAVREAVGGRLGFVCYYNLWLRHYNNEAADPQLAYPMEYATVRNNIYRVKIAFTGPGDPEPSMREPDTMQARIYVMKWNFRPQEEIVM